MRLHDEHGMALLESLLQICGRGNQDPVAAALAVRTFLPEDASLERREELFRSVRRRWTNRKDTRVSTDTFVLVITACGWEDLLVQFLLQNHVADALDDVRALLPACQRLVASGAAALTFRVLDAFLTVVLLFICGSDVDFSRHVRLLEEVTSSPCACSRFPSAASILSEQGKRQSESKDDSWKDFFQLPTAVDERKFNTKSGRVLGPTIVQVVEQQEHMLSLSRRRCEGSSPFDFQSNEPQMVIEQLWELAHEVLEIGSSLRATSCCVGCVGKQSDEDVDLTALHDQINRIADDTSLERYLTQKAAGSDGVARSQVAQPVLLQADDPRESELRHFHQLLGEVHCGVTRRSSIADLLPKAQDELSGIEDLEVLGIQVSLLIAAQLRSKQRILDVDSEIYTSCKRQVLRVFNSLTDGSDVRHDLRALTVLAGFCSSQMILEIVHRSMVSPQYSHIYIQVFALCPLLLDWRVEGCKEPLMILELQKTFKGIITEPKLFETQRQHFLALLCALTGLTSTEETPRGRIAAVLQIQSLVEDVVIPVHEMLVQEEKEMPDKSERFQYKSNYFGVVQEWIHRINVSDPRWKRSASTVQAIQPLLAVLTSTYVGETGVISARTLSLKNTLLLSIKDLVGMASSLTEPVLLDTILSDCTTSDTLDEPLLMLIEQVLPTNDSWLDRREFQSLQKVSEWFDKESTSERMTVEVNDASDAVRLLLWKLLWGSVCTETEQNASPQRHRLITDARAWQLMDFVASQPFDHASDSKTWVAMGRAVVQREVAHVLLLCGPSLFPSLYTGVLPNLAKYETSFSHALQFPAEILLQSESSDCTKSLDCPLCSVQPAHEVLKYVVKCWSVVAISSGRCRDFQDQVVLEMARHVLASIDHAISASKASLSGLLYCFQWLCYAVWVIDSSHLKESSQAIKNQLDIALLRLLYVLDQTQVTVEEDASFSKRFVASWISYLPQESYEQAFNFVASANKNLE